MNPLFIRSSARSNGAPSPVKEYETRAKIPKCQTMATQAEITGSAPHETLEAFARKIIVNYFHKMMSYKVGAKAGTDIESVHNMRVTSRRLRAAMDNFAGCFPKKPFKRHYNKIKAITQTMGAVRDLDVLIARFQNELANLTEAEQAGIRDLIAHLQQRRQAARQPMLTLFEELEDTGFETEFLEFFTRPEKQE